MLYVLRKVPKIREILVKYPLILYKILIIIEINRHLILD